MEKETIIDKYVTGELSAEEQAAFAKWQVEDPTFMEEVKFRSDIAAVAFEREAMELKARLAGVEKKVENKGKNTIKRVLFILLGLALITAAVIGYRMDMKQNSPEGIYAAHYETYPNVYHPVTRGGSDVMTKAFMAYESGNYKEAAEFLEERIATSNAIPLKFYQAIAYGEMGNFPLAIKNLENIRRFESDYYSESYWYLSLYYIRQGNKAAAIDRLQTFYEIIDDEDRKNTTADLIFQLQGS